MDDGYECLDGKDDSPYFVLKATNGQVIGNSQLYSSAASRDNGIASCKTNAPGAATDEQA